MNLSSETKSPYSLQDFLRHKLSRCSFLVRRPNNNIHWGEQEIHFSGTSMWPDGSTQTDFSKLFSCSYVFTRWYQAPKLARFLKHFLRNKWKCRKNTLSCSVKRNSVYLEPHQKLIGSILWSQINAQSACLKKKKKKYIVLEKMKFYSLKFWSWVLNKSKTFSRLYAFSFRSYFLSHSNGILLVFISLSDGILSLSEFFRHHLVDVAPTERGVGLWVTA